jgi:hypothetical protein
VRYAELEILDFNQDHKNGHVLPCAVDHQAWASDSEGDMEKLNSQERIVEAVKQLAHAHTEGIANKSLAHLVETS